MYYQLDEKGDIYYEDAGHIETYPELPRGVGLKSGERIDIDLDVPLRFRMDPEWGKDMTLMMGTSDSTSIDADFDRLVIDEAKCKDLLLFRLAENITAIIVDERVKREVEKRGIKGIFFYASGKWSG